MLRSQEYRLEDFDFYFRNLKKNYAKNQIQEKLLKDVLINTSSKGELNIEKLESLVTEIQTNLDMIQGKESMLRSMEALGQTYRGVLVDRMKGKSKFSTGDSFLDKSLAVGFASGQITTIFGATGIGKSMFALNLISKQINKSIPCLYISMEMDEMSTMDRLMAMRQRVSTSMFHTQSDGTFNDIAFTILDEEMKKYAGKNSKFFLVDNPSISTKDVEVLIKEAKNKMGVDYLICTLDLATMLTDMGEKPSEIEQSMNRLSAIAKRQNVHIVCIVQANRGVDAKSIEVVESIKKLKPKSLHGIKNSAAFAERSRIVLSVFRAKYYANMLFPNEPETQIMDDIFEVSVLKQSQGLAGTEVKYLYEPEFFRLYPYLEVEDAVRVEESDIREEADV
jgi:replicative DNA helicase